VVISVFRVNHAWIAIKLFVFVSYSVLFISFCDVLDLSIFLCWCLPVLTVAVGQILF
jgi:hypothetical protein